MINFKRGLVVLSMTLMSLSAHAQIKGAGSTFAATLYENWNVSLAKQGDINMVYEPVGSSAGVRAARSGSVDFGATDRPLSRSELTQAGMAQFPTAIGGVVVLTNLQGIDSGQIKLDGPTLGGLYSGEIKRWNDPAIKALNPTLNMPDVAVVPVFRSGGSGTSFIFSSYLAKVSPGFAKAVGVTSEIAIAGGKGAPTSAEVVKVVRAINGGIGYVDYSFAADLNLPTVQMKNQWGTVVSANRESMQLAMRSADWERLMIDQDPTFELDLTDAGCPGCWPMASLTYVLIPLKGSAANSVRVLEFFERALREGDALANKEGYVPLPSRAKSVVAVAMRRWFEALEKAGGGKAKRLSGDFLPATVVASVAVVNL